MQVSEIISQVRANINEKNSLNSHVTDAQLLQWINDCTLQLLSTVNTYPKVSATFTAANTITLTSSILSVDFATISDVNGKHNKLETIDFDNFVRANPSYQDTPSSKPYMLVRMNVNEWMLYPSPDANYIGKDVVIVGKTLPDNLTLTTQEPPVSISLHSCYIYYALWKCWQVLNNDAKATDSYQTYEAIRIKNMGIATNTRGSLKCIKMTGYK